MLFCGDCIVGTRPLPHLGYAMPEKVCEKCMDADQELASPDSAAASAASAAASASSSASCAAVGGATTVPIAVPSHAASSAATAAASASGSASPDLVSPSTEKSFSGVYFSIHNFYKTCQCGVVVVVVVVFSSRGSFYASLLHSFMFCSCFVLLLSSGAKVRSRRRGSVLQAASSVISPQ